MDLERSVVKLARKGHSPKNVTLLLNVKYHYVLKIFKKHNLKLQGSGGNNKVVNKNPFIKKEGNYWLGFFAADGCISKTKYSVFLGIKDLDHIKKYQQFVNKNLKIYYRYNQAGSLIGYVIYRSQLVWEYLNTLGITPAKSLSFEYKGELNFDFIRGYFDGDGSISKREPKITTGSEKFKNQLIKFFNEHNITTSISTKGTDNIVYDIYIRGNSRIEFFNQIYSRRNTLLKRKYTNYRAALKKFRVKNIG